MREGQSIGTAALWGSQGAHHMREVIASSQSLAGLLETGSDDAPDWDPSALADWPNVAPTQPATVFTAEPQAGTA